MKGKSIIVAIIVGVFCVLSIWVGGEKIFKVIRRSKVISVKGNASYNITSDIIIWDATYTNNNVNIQAGYETINGYRKAIQEYIKQYNLPDSCITFQSVRVDKNFEESYINNHYYSKFVDYTISQRVRIVSNDVNKVEDLSRNITTLLNKGIYIESSMPHYYYSKLEESKHELLELASQDARERAQAIAKGSKKHVGQLISSQMGVFQIVGLYSDEDYHWGGNFNTKDKVKTISITVNNSYSIK